MFGPFLKKKKINKVKKAFMQARVTAELRIAVLLELVVGQDQSFP
jgi:hypothetical protein